MIYMNRFMLDIKTHLSVGVIALAMAVFLIATPTYASQTNNSVTIVTPECSDGLDNDGDTFIDLLDPDCTGILDNDESAPVVVVTPTVTTPTGNSGGGFIPDSDAPVINITHVYMTSSAIRLDWTATDASNIVYSTVSYTNDATGETITLPTLVAEEFFSITIPDLSPDTTYTVTLTCDDSPTGRNESTLDVTVTTDAVAGADGAGDATMQVRNSRLDAESVLVSWDFLNDIVPTDIDHFTFITRTDRPATHSADGDAIAVFDSSKFDRVAPIVDPTKSYYFTLFYTDADGNEHGGSYTVAAPTEVPPVTVPDDTTGDDTSSDDTSDAVYLVPPTISHEFLSDDTLEVSWQYLDGIVPAAVDQYVLVVRTDRVAQNIHDGDTIVYAPRTDSNHEFSVSADTEQLYVTIFVQADNGTVSTGAYTRVLRTDDAGEGSRDKDSELQFEAGNRMVDEDTIELFWDFGDAEVPANIDSYAVVIRTDRPSLSSTDGEDIQPLSRDAATFQFDKEKSYYDYVATIFALDKHGETLYTEYTEVLSSETDKIRILFSPEPGTIAPATVAPQATISLFDDSVYQFVLESIEPHQISRALVQLSNTEGIVMDCTFDRCQTISALSPELVAAVATNGRVTVQVVVDFQDGTRKAYELTMQIQEGVDETLDPLDAEEDIVVYIYDANATSGSDPVLTLHGYAAVKGYLENGSYLAEVYVNGSRVHTEQLEVTDNLFTITYDIAGDTIGERVSSYIAGVFAGEFTPSFWLFWLIVFGLAWFFWFILWKRRKDEEEEEDELNDIT